MRYCLLLLWLTAGCASVSVHAPVAAVPSEDEVRTRARALLAAYDGSDEAGFLGGIGETFTLFEAKHVHPREELLETMQQRRARGAAPMLRSFGEEQVRVSGQAAVYIGQSTEHAAAEPDRPAQDYEGWNTLVFVRGAGGALVAVHWAWEPAGSAGTRDVWNAMFRDPTPVLAAPNQTLVDAVRGVEPGSALDVGAGQGRNALFLAEQGWQVTAVDISDVALSMARDEAAKRGLSLRLVQADLDDWDFGTARWDLVTMIYMGSDEAMVARAQASLKPRGLFVLSGFAPEPDAAGPDSTAGGRLRTYFGDDYQVLRDEIVEGISDWGRRKTRLIHFVARKLR